MRREIWCIFCLGIIVQQKGGVRGLDGVRFEIEWPSDGLCLESPVSVHFVLDVSDGAGAAMLRAEDAVLEICYQSRRYSSSMRCMPMNRSGEALVLAEGSHILDAWLNHRIGNTEFMPILSVKKAVHIHIKKEKACPLTPLRLDPSWLRGLLGSSLYFGSLVHDMIAQAEQAILLIPAGLRCWTRPQLRQLGLSGASLPFDNGYFTLRTVLNVLQNDNFHFTRNSTRCLLKHGEFDDAIRFQVAECDDVMHLYHTNNKSGILPNGTQITDPTDSKFLISYHPQSTMVLAHYGYQIDAYHCETGDKILAHYQATFRRRIARLKRYCADPHTSNWFLYVHTQKYISSIQLSPTLIFNVLDIEDIIEFGHYIKQACGSTARLLIFVDPTIPNLSNLFLGARIHSNTLLFDIKLYREFGVLLASLRDAHLVNFVLS